MVEPIGQSFPRPSNSLTDDQHASFEDNGYLILKGFYSNDELADFLEDTSELIEQRQQVAGKITIDILEGDEAGRYLLSQVSDQALTHPYKINDLYLDLPACHALNFNPRMMPILGRLLHKEPMVINSLTFKKGSQQTHYFDTYYMPPPVENQMVVTSICLEDQHPDAGPLSYYPGSHKIPAYHFSHAGIHAVADEMPAATAFIEQSIKDRGLQCEEFIGRKGDLFIWHAQLYHGGLPIQNKQLTRRTLVTHYWRAADVSDADLIRTPQGCYMNRGHLVIERPSPIGGSRDLEPLGLIEDYLCPSPNIRSVSSHNYALSYNYP
jgi:phytanoyl-CoA hydroxylase